ncbi:putative hemolysin [Sphingobium wenxiniae]|uniref:DNA-binding protein n=2 Tax=Sphingobium TaxID=165695 RepID=T0G5G8_9SPHN|nr:MULTISPECIES: CNNM domain-containing protein [Sphingobium]EQA98935.1 DNA-binding protein [Sphingobium baderi LL03]KMS61106.1 DNA-binding protein [Sphingobium baderi LL03]MBB6190277.1 putative hemolysin [Sphingobium wenxiniae]TWH94996.1 putative hemolysin [Sphingobium wenxiniae]WRD75089.1 hemolysin family protein [Sphingobium baderi]
MAMLSPHSLSPFPWVDLVIILALVALNGVFAMSELAIVSSRKPRLQAMEKAGRRGARSALTLASDPGKFLSTVQIGITLIGIVAGAYSGASLGGPVGERLRLLGLSPHLAANLGFALVIGLTTYASLIVGELVPKQFALRRPEAIAVVVAKPMMWLARLTAPVVWVLDGSSALIFRLLGMTRESEDHVTAEELHLIVAEASRSGVIEESERAIISGVVRLADRPVREVMTQRMDVDWIDIGADEATIRARLLETPHTRLPVGRGSVEDIVGIVQARDIMTALFRGEALDLEALIRKAEVVPDQVDAMDALEVLRRADVPMVMVHDEYGHFEGIVTPADLLSAIAGHFASDRDTDEEPDLVEREDGSLLVSGQMPMDQLADRIGIDLPENRDYATVAGHALWLLKRLPEVGDHVDDQGWRFEIVDMDGRKIDKLLIAER